MNVAMGLTVCVICGGENDTNGCHLAGFSEDVAFTRYFMAIRSPCRRATGIDYASKNYLKWREIQLAILPIVGG